VIYNLNRKTKQQFYQSKEWKQTRNYRLYLDSYLCQCEWCKINQYIKAATEVHHIIDVDEDWNKRLDIDNLQSLSHECHSRITMERLRAKQKEAKANQPTEEEILLNKAFGLE
tara:strand:+ start:646 stop:984 length:339 start_codon:yes stop_codon:yes gene_type:complete